MLMDLDILLLNVARFSLIAAGAVLGLIYLKGAERVWRASRSALEVLRFTLAQGDKAAAVLVSAGYCYLIATSHDRVAGSWVGIAINTSVLLVLLGSIRGALIGAGDRWNVKGRERKD